MPPIAFLQFHSRSALLTPRNNPFGLPAETGRLLSNFGNIPVTWHGLTYPTVEHAFQAAKYRLASNRPEVAVEFVEGGSIGPDPVMAKRAGSRKGMQTRGAVLDVALWNRLSDDVMKELIRAKKDHPVIHGILEICHSNNIALFHFSRSDMKWGCHVTPEGVLKKGENRLGRIYEALH